METLKSQHPCAPCQYNQLMKNSKLLTDPVYSEWGLYLIEKKNIEKLIEVSSWLSISVKE